MRNCLYILGLLAGILLSSCEQKLPLYEDNQARLSFLYANRADSLASYSFVYNKQLTQDTVWFTVNTIGFIATEDRPLELTQIPTGQDDAVPGKHYLAFNTPSLAPFYTIKSGSTSARIPIVVLKDPSLNEKDFRIRVEIKNNGIFMPGYTEFSYKLLTISNRLVKPSNWQGLMNYIFGNYGTVKHQFMIDNSDKKWDEEYLYELGVHNYSADQGFLQFWANKFQKLLNEFNAQQQQQGKQPLSEADGTLVQFQK
ncbi:MAG TPA: DUF4843 domain-containing protein [Prevotella sp.]